MTPTDYSGSRDAPDESSQPRAEAAEHSLGNQWISTALGLSINGACRFAMSWIVGRGYGVVALGAFQSGLSASKLGALFGPGALGTAASSFFARGRGDAIRIAQINSHLNKRYAQVSAVIAVATAILWLLLVSNEPLGTVAVVALTLGFSSYSLSRGRLYGLGHVKRAIRWSNITSIAGLLIVGGLALLNAPVSYLMLGLAISYYGFSLANRQAKTISAEVDRKLTRELDHFILFAMAGTLASTGFLEMSMVLAVATGGTTSAGYYGAAFVLATPALLIGSAASLVLFPRLSSGQDDRAARAAVIGESSKLLAAGLLPAFAVIILLREDIVRLVWGEGFEEAAGALGPMLMAILVSTIAIPSVTALTSHSARGVRLSAGATWIGALTGAFTWIALVPTAGITGIAYGFLIGSAVSSALPFVLTWRNEQLAWGFHALQILLGCLSISIAALVQARYQTGFTLDIILAVVVCLIWMVVTRSDQLVIWRMARTIVARRR